METYRVGADGINSEALKAKAFDKILDVYADQTVPTDGDTSQIVEAYLVDSDSDA